MSDGFAAAARTPAVESGAEAPRAEVWRRSSDCVARSSILTVGDWRSQSIGETPGCTMPTRVKAAGTSA